MTKEEILKVAHKAILDAEIWDIYNKKETYVYHVLGYVNGVHELTERLLISMEGDE